MGAFAASRMNAAKGARQGSRIGHMWEILFYVLVLAFVAGAIVIGALFLRGYLTGTSPSGGLFGQRPERRLGVIEQSNLDGRRRLVLIRRDDVEHLIMTGGPVDVVIETNISTRQAPEVQDKVAPVFSRAPRNLTQAVNEH